MILQGPLNIASGSKPQVKLSRWFILQKKELQRLLAFNRLRIGQCWYSAWSETLFFQYS